MLSKYLLKNNLEPSVEYIDLYSFIKFVECFRYKSKISIKEFFYKNKKQMGLYYFSSGAGLSQGTEAFLEELGIKNYEDVHRLLDSNTEIIFDKIISGNNPNYFDEYCKLASCGELDTLLRR